MRLTKKIASLAVLGAMTLAAGCDEKELDVGYCAAWNFIEGGDLPDDGIVEDSGDGSIAVTDGMTLSDAMTFEGAIRITGAMPIPGSPTGGALASAVTDVPVSDNSAYSLQTSSSGVAAGRVVAGIVFQVSGADEYFVIPASALQTSSTEYVMTLLGPIPDVPGTNQISATTDNFATATVSAFLVDTGDPVPDFASGNWQGIADPANWLTADTINIDTTAVSTGLIQVSLTWDTQADIDLWLTEPNGHRIYYGDKNSTAGDGFLDVDNTSEYGPENIFYAQDAASGLYKVEVNYYGPGGLASSITDTNYTISIAACNDLQVFTGDLVSDDETELVKVFNYYPGCKTLDDPVVTDPPVQNAWKQVLCE